MEWKIIEGRLQRGFEFQDFKEAVNFVNRILPLAEEMNHHPNIFIHSYNKVKIILFTHEENKVTEKDNILASKIDGLTNYN
jgi:4a-hydroxytetrahydrobiopterin dehydratase